MSQIDDLAMLVIGRDLSFKEACSVLLEDTIRINGRWFKIRVTNNRLNLESIDVVALINNLNRTITRMLGNDEEAFLKIPKTWIVPSNSYFTSTHWFVRTIYKPKLLVLMNEETKEYVQYTIPDDIFKGIPIEIACSVSITDDQKRVVVIPKTTHKIGKEIGERERFFHYHSVAVGNDCSPEIIVNNDARSLVEAKKRIEVAINIINGYSLARTEDVDEELPPYSQLYEAVVTTHKEERKIEGEGVVQWM